MMLKEKLDEDMEIQPEDLSGLTRAESPIPAGGLCVITGYGLEHSQRHLRMLILQNEPLSFPEGYSNLSLGSGEQANVVQQHENVLTVSIPNDKFAAYAFYFEGNEKLTKSLVINKARLDWLSTENSETEATIRAFGRALVNLDLYPLRDEADHPVSFSTYVKSETKVAVKDAAGVFYWAETTKTSAYEVEFILPSALSQGICKVYIHNGLGGEIGWSEPIELRVGNKDTWSEDVFSVKDFGAIGDGFSDDTVAIQKTLNAIRENGGGVAFFPAGGYHFAKTLRVPPKTVLKGENKERSWLFMPDGYNTNARDHSAVVGIAGEGGIGLEELSIHAVYANVVIAAPVGEKMPQAWTDLTRIDAPEPGFENADDSFVKNCRILHNFSHLYHRRYDDETFMNLPYLREEMKTHWNSS
ncbi:MAG: hypothetical protein H7X94_02510, partial [Vallitaleaceae bacterium]|nr:hypothetical protein [Vallitaleaceae bacterium]